MSYKVSVFTPIDGQGDPESLERSLMVISSVRVFESASHDRVQVFNRSGLSGDLVVVKGDGRIIAERLMMGWEYEVRSES